MSASFTDAPGTRPSRRAYPPPLPGFNADAGGRDAIEHCIRTQVPVKDQNIEWRAAHPQGIDPDVLRDNAGAFAVSDAALALKPALDAAKAQVDEAQREAVSGVQGQKVDPTDVAAQLAADRFWHRTEKVLDSIKDPAKLAAAAQDLITNASDAEILVISEELAPYLQSRGVPTGWIPNALAARNPELAEKQAKQLFWRGSSPSLPRITRT
jgi:hypothetical protein